MFTTCVYLFYLCLGQMNLLHPLATLRWRCSCALPWGDRVPMDSSVLIDRIAGLTRDNGNNLGDVLYTLSTDLCS